jgi:hypothetical protein
MLEAVFISIAPRLNGLFARILRCFPLQSTKDCCGKSPCLRSKNPRHSAHPAYENRFYKTTKSDKIKQRGK